MGEWKEYKLSNAPLQIIDGDRGKNYPSQEEYSSVGDCLFLSTKNVRFTGFDFSECQFISKERDELLRKGKIERNDLVLTTRGTVGNIGFYSDNVKYNNIRINSGMVIIRPDKNKLVPSFNYYIFRHLQKDFLTFTTGSAQPQLPIRDLNEIEIVLPPLPEQERIADVLSSLDDKIDLLHRNNKTLEQLAETLFRQWFVEDTQESCKKNTLGELVKIIDNRGKTPSFSEIKTNYPIIEVNALNGKNRYIDYSLIKKYVDEHTYNNWFRAGHPKVNDILFSTVGSIGEMSMMLNPAGTIAQNIVALRAEKISPYYLYQYLLSIQDEIKEFDIGSVQPSIKVTHLTKIEIPLPDSNKVNLFDKQAKDICNKIAVNYNQLQQLETLRDTLLPKLMSGVVRVEE